ncbi:hypothetical protein [Actinocrispum wychmicini]|uniref:Peptidase inhibitor family I36 n=1 Tax=Actinocrispum wychmicini TaxID=1213861 RepID=A0A4R2JHK1_9PSEU|nr:hypothetical protein [Actinocrispum wychmicini]TCO55869.1 hypothetical protein EV192_107292 [Actinocrispum wychmicini]
MRRFVIAFVLMAAGLLMPGMANAAPSTADQATVLGGCRLGHCGQVYNTGSATVWAIRDFDANGPKPGTEWRALGHGDRTDPGEDWDGFYVQCDSYGQTHSWWPPGWWTHDSFTLPGGWWMKIETNQIAEVTSRC